MGKWTRENITKQLRAQLKMNQHLIGVAAGSGLTAKYAEEGGADFIMALSSGYFRQKGLSSLGAYLPFLNSNRTVMEFGSKELLLRTKRIPVIFGLFASDPTIQLSNYIQSIKESGFAGINNYPTIGLMDGDFRNILEEGGFSFQREVEAIRIANELNMFTVAFVFNCEQALQMVRAGADVICIHLGLTIGGRLGARQILSLQTAKKIATEIIKEVLKVNPNIIKMIYGGPVNTPVDVQFMYDGTNIDGYIGGSVFERIPAEQVVLQVTQSFKQTYDIKYEELIQKMMSGINKPEDYIDFVKQYVSLHYMEEVSLKELAS